MVQPKIYIYIIFSCCLNIPTNRLWTSHPGNYVPPCGKDGPANSPCLSSPDYDQVTCKTQMKSSHVLCCVLLCDPQQKHLPTGPHSLSALHLHRIAHSGQCLLCDPLGGKLCLPPLGPVRKRISHFHVLLHGVILCLHSTEHQKPNF